VRRNHAAATHTSENHHPKVTCRIRSPLASEGGREADGAGDSSGATGGLPASAGPQAPEPSPGSPL